MMGTFLWLAVFLSYNSDTTDCREC